MIKTFEQNPQDIMKAIIGMQENIPISGDGLISFDFIESAVEYENEILSEYDTKIQLIQNNLEILSKQKVFDSAILKDVKDFKIDPVVEAGKDSPKAAYDIVQSWYVKVNEEREAFEKVLSSFKSILERGKERSGHISFEVGFLNEGDSDGVVFPGGKLHIGDRTLKVESERRQYGVIRGHSFSKYLFMIKEEEVPQRDLDYLKSIVSKYMSEEFEFSINTTTGTESFKNDLPVN